MSKEYSGAIVILIVAVLKVFKIEIDNGAIEGIVVGIVALWVAYNRYKKGDISIGGFRKPDLNA